MRAILPWFLIIFCSLASESLPGAVIYTRLGETYDAFAREVDDVRGFSTLPLDFNDDGIAEFVVTVFGSQETAILHNFTSRVFILSGQPPNIGGSAASITGGVLIAGDGGNANFRWYQGQPVANFFTDEYPDLPKRLTTIGIQFSTGSTGHTRGKDGYIGFEFTLEDGVHYGWMHLDASTAGKDSNGIVRGVGGYIDGWAWETTPGMGIVAGSIPEPSAGILVVFALGGSLLIRKRGS